MARIDQNRPPSNLGGDASRVAAQKDTATNEFDAEVNTGVSTATSPAARSYSDKARARLSSGALKGRAPPLGHVEPPSSDKMRQIAELGGGGMATPNFTEPPPQTGGVGSSYSANQAVATSKGPITLSEANAQSEQKSALSKGTQQALNMAEENVRAAKVARDEPPPPEPDPTSAEKTRAELAEAEKDFEPETPGFDFSAISDAREGLISPKRKKIIEARLAPLNIADLVMKQEMVQEVPVVLDKLTYRMRTFNQRENLWILKYLWDFPGSGLYTQELLQTCRLTCGLVAVNDALLPEHRLNIGAHQKEDIDKDAFETKMAVILSYPVQLIADMSVQYIWFQGRVDDLLTVDDLKNG